MFVAASTAAGGKPPRLRVVRRPASLARAPSPRDPRTPELAIRERLYAELQPVRLANCTLERIGEATGWRLPDVRQPDARPRQAIPTAFRATTAGAVGVSTRLRVPVHQYDCFDLRRTQCDGGDMQFHPECIAASASTDGDGRPFDSLTNQLARNGDAGRRLLVKMDVEGAEWDSLLATPASVLERIDQLAIEIARQRPRHLRSSSAWCPS